jgi:hypothetical protein
MRFAVVPCATGSRGAASRRTSIGITHIFMRIGSNKWSIAEAVEEVVPRSAGWYRARNGEKAQAPHVVTHPEFGRFRCGHVRAAETLVSGSVAWAAVGPGRRPWAALSGGVWGALL